MNKDINDYTYEDLQDDIELKSFIEHNTPSEIDISDIRKKVFLKMHQQERKSRQRHVLMHVSLIAATLPLLIGTKYVVIENAVDGLPRMEITELMTDIYDEEVEVPVDERMTLMLADGIRIVANLHTIVRYPKRFGGEYREIYVRGETYFDVACDVEHSFLVHSDNFRVKALGTRFNVNSYDTSDSQVMLVQETIELKATNNDRAHTRPNELVSLQGGSFAGKRAVNTGEHTCWMQGIINLDGGSVESVAQQLGHYYGAAILFDDGMPANKFYGKLVLGDRVSEALRSIETMTQTHMEIHGDTTCLIKK